jgi:competence protein ComEA
VRRPQAGSEGSGRQVGALTSDGVRSSARRSDDADLIRARLRAVLSEMDQAPGWVPPEDLLDDPDPDDDPDADGEDGGGDDDPVGGRTRAAPVPRRLPVDPDAALPPGLGRHRSPGVAARLDPGRSGAWALWLTGLLAAVLVVGWTWADRPEVERVAAGATSERPSASPPAAPAAPAAPTATPASTPDPPPGGVVVVSVVGQVARPGLVTLPAGSRVADALAAAGGLLPDADPAAVNAAAPLTDGEQIAVGVPGAAAPPGVAGGTGGGAANGGLLDLNTATVGDLDALPGIGPVLAQRIVDHRSARGAFTSVEQLDDVPGIGPAIYAELSGQVTV